MKKINKKYFLKAVSIILITLFFIVVINVFSSELLKNGIDSLFTTNVYKTAFETTDLDIKFINLFKILSIAITMLCGYFNLEANSEEMRLEKWYRKEMSLIG